MTTAASTADRVREQSEASLSEITRALELLVAPGDVHELRVLGTVKGNGSGYFDDLGTFADTAAKAGDSRLNASGVYFTMNPCQWPAENRIESNPKRATRDDEIVARRWLLIDCDVQREITIRTLDGEEKRETKISATDAEHAAALKRALEVRAFLTGLGWPPPIYCDSGNGAHLLYRIDLPNDPAATATVKGCLEALAARFDDALVKVDRTVYNASRILKVYGTVARKGANTIERPHRLARIIEVPGKIETVGRALLEQAAAFARDQSSRSNSNGTGPRDRFDLAAFIARYKIEVLRTKDWNAGKLYILRKCVFDATHTGTSAALLQLAGGALVYHCFHNSCAGKAWRDVRILFEGQDGANAEPPEWLDPIPLDMPILPTLPRGIFPGWSETFIDAVAAATETPRELAALMELGTIASAAQGKFKVELKRGYEEPLNLWAIAALPSGHRKTQVLQTVTDPLVQWEFDQLAKMEPEIIAAKSKKDNMVARIESLRKKAARNDNAIERGVLEKEILDLEKSLPKVPAAPRVWSQDVTPEKLGVLMAENSERLGVISDEGGIFDILAGRYSNGIPNLDLWLKGHAGSAVRVDRGSRPPVIINTPALTMVLSPQPDVLQGLARKPGFRGRGLLARGLYMLPVSRIGYRSGETQPVMQAVASAHHRNIRALLELKPSDDGRPGMIKLSAEAYAEWRAFADAAEMQMREGGRFEHLQDWAGKLPGAAARIAGCLHVAEHATGAPAKKLLSFATMQRALDFAAVLSVHALAAFDLMGADTSLKDARKVWKWIERERKARFSFRDCFAALRGSYPRVEDLEHPIAVLIERHHIAVQPSPRRPGRPSRVFGVNPKLAEGWKS